MAKITKATDEQKKEYAAMMLRSEPPLYGFATIQGVQCVIEYLGEGQGEPNYELMAPDGYCLGPELHSSLSSTLAELREDVRETERTKSLERCDAECPCRHGGKLQAP